MYSDTKKIQLIEEVLRTENQQVLKEVEAILKKSRKISAKKLITAHDLSGQWSQKDAELIDKAIEDGCEKIYKDEWR
jgi:hypothetical protein